jgi:AraC-like DNA-binding protein
MSTIPVREIKPTPGEPKISQTFRIRELSTILGGRDMSQDTHRHNFFFVLALKKGKGKHVIDFVEYAVQDNCVFVMRPGQVHQLDLKAGSEGYLMEFNMEFYRLNDRGTGQVLRKATSANLCAMPATAFDKLHFILQAIFQEYSDAKDGYNSVIRAQLDIFFIEFVRNRQQNKTAPSDVNPYEQERLDEFIQLIEDNVSVKKQVSEYAEMLNISPYQLSAITRNLMGKTPSEIITDYIILEAKRHLLATSDQVNQIAWHLGYEDPSYFIRFFRKHTGISPEAFRLNSR